MFNYEYFIIFFKNFLKISIDAHCFHKPEPKSKIQNLRHVYFVHIIIITL